MATSKKALIWSWLTIFILLGMVIPEAYSQPANTQAAAQQPDGIWTEENIVNEKIWSSEPILSDILYGTYGFTANLQAAVGLSEKQLEAIKQLAQHVLLQLRLLNSEARLIETNENLTFEEKRGKIKEMGFNQRVVAVVNSADKAVKGVLSPGQYVKFMTWAEQTYEEASRLGEEYRHRPPPDISNAPVKVLPPPQR